MDRLTSLVQANTAWVATAMIVPVALVAFDLRTRFQAVRNFKRQLRHTYQGGAVLSLVVWVLLFEAARHPRRSVRAVAIAALAFTAAFGIGGQAFYRVLTNGYVNREALMLATQMQDVIGGWMESNLLTFGAALALPAAAVVLAAYLRTRFLGKRIQAPGIFAACALFFFAFALFAPISQRWFDCLPPDILLLNACGGPLLLYARLIPPPRSLPPGEHAALPTLAKVDDEAPSIVLLFGESVRADRMCSAPSPSCDLSPELDRAAPGRIGYGHAYALASCTELSSAWLFSGLGVTARIQEIAEAPLLWDYAKARGYRTAYIASQHLGFQNLGIFVHSSRIDTQREARDRGREWGVNIGSPDETSTKEALEFLRAPGPAFVVVHFSNTHDPYRVVQGYEKYPIKVSKWLPESRKHAYYNALQFQDVVIGDFLRALRADERGKKAIVVYVSDHGEAWGEHEMIGHTTDVFSEQLDVPLWIDGPASSFPAEAVARMRAEAATRPTPIVDVSATLIDLMGALDAPELQGRVAKLAGKSLLRPTPEPRRVFLWNCPEYRACNVVSFGAVEWPLKFHWEGRLARYACNDDAADPSEHKELPLEHCAALRAAVLTQFGAPEAP